MTTSAAAVSTAAAAEHPAGAMLLVGALGVVFGDIGTSPIYAFRESLKAAGSAEAQATVLGILFPGFLGGRVGCRPKICRVRHARR
jgi:KUP system potassium uptake protein